jgi:hypothetical protein
MVYRIAQPQIPPMRSRNASTLTDGHWNVGSRMIHRFLLNQSFRDKAGQGLPTGHLYGIASAHAICPSKPSVLAMSR